MLNQRGLEWIVIVSCIATNAAISADWPHWRGPEYNGSSPEVGLAEQWNREQGIVWSAAMPGPSEATPIVWRDHVFVSSVQLNQDALVAIALDAKSGRVVWQKTVGSPLRRDSRSTFGGPSPCTDGERVIFFYGNGDLLAYTLTGQELWKRNIPQDYGEFAFNWTFSASPLLYDGTLYVQVVQRDVPVDGRGIPNQENKSYLLGLDPTTGSELWRAFRASEAREESREAFSSPIPYTHQGRKEILIAGADVLTGHDPTDGHELWRWGTWNPQRITHWRFVPSPVAGSGIVLACAPKNDPIYAVKAGGTGILTDQALAWVSRDEKAITSDVPTPAFAEGDFFILSDGRKQLSRVEPISGTVKWTVSTPGRVKYEASPLVADNKVYIINFAAEVAVFDAQQGQLLNVIPMEDPDHAGSDFNVRSSIIAAQSRLFIRTNSHLYCVGR